MSRQAAGPREGTSPVAPGAAGDDGVAAARLRGAEGHSRAGRAPQLSLVREPADLAPGAEDAALFARIAGGDSDAFSELYQRYFGELYDFAARITRDRETAGDIVQSVFAAVWERARKGERVQAPRAWLYRVTHNAAIDEIRRRGRMAQPNGDDGFDFAEVADTRSREPARTVIDKELAELVWSTAASLKPDDYALLDLHVRRDLAPDEMADELGITTGALYTRLSRLRRSFEDALTVKLLTRRGEQDCDELAELISRLGARADTPEANKLLGAHIRDCATCQESRRRFVTASEILAGIAPIPLLPGVQEAVWSHLGGAAGVGAAAHAVAPGRAGSSAHGARVARAAHARPLASVAVSLAAAAVLAVGMWAVLGPSATGAARDPSRVWSPTHQLGGRASENRVRILWSRQPDALAYSLMWSHAPQQEPDTGAELRGSATGTTSPPLAPGRWYFHMRTEGRDHSWTHSVHVGPFVITARAAPGSGSSAGAPPAPVPPPGTSGSPTPTPTPTSSAAPPVAPPAATPSPAAPVTPPAATPAPTAPPGDSTPPSGQMVELAGGPYYRGLAVALVLKHGIDRESRVDPATGLVQRRTGVLEGGTCGRWSGNWRTVALERSTDSTVANGRCYRYRYRIADRAGNRSAFSRPSRVAMVDTIPPSPPALSLSESGASSFVLGTAIFIRPGAGGSFTVAAASADHGSGVAAVEFPALAPGGPPTRRTTAPYTTVYRWSGEAVTAGSKVVISRDWAGNTARARFRVAADADPPTGMSVTLSGGPWFAASVPLVVAGGSDAGSGEDRASVTVERQTAPLQAGSCGAFGDAWAPVSLQAGADAGVQSGRCYRYHVSASDNVGNRSSSSLTSAARVDATPPSAPQITPAASAPGAHVSGTSVFYRPGAAGALTVAATTADDESGVEQVQFPALAGAIGGGSDDTAPYAADYTWTQALTAAGPQIVIARNRAGLVSDAAFTVAADADPPTGMSVTLSGGPWFAASVPLTVEVGADAGSGVNRESVTVERQTAPLLAGACGSFEAAWAPVSLQAGADAAVQSARCYRYRVSVSDNLGNRSSSPPSGDARIDTTAPSPPRLTLAESEPTVSISGATVFYRPGAPGALTVAATTADSESGIERVLFPTLPGAAGGGGDDTTPYATDYTWTQALAAAGPQAVAARNPAGLSSDGVFTLSADADPPTGVAVRLLGGPTYPGGAVPVQVDEGADAGSGVDRQSVMLERDSAPLTAAGCGSYTGAWAPLSIPGSADTTVVAGNCYRYRAGVSDNVGNRATSPPSPDAKVG